MVWWYAGWPSLNQRIPRWPAVRLRVWGTTLRAAATSELATWHPTTKRPFRCWLRQHQRAPSASAPPIPCASPGPSGALGRRLSSDTKFYAVGEHEDLRSHHVRNSRFFRGQRARLRLARCPLKKSLKLPRPVAPAVAGPEDELVCLTVYRKGAR